MLTLGILYFSPVKALRQPLDTLHITCTWFVSLIRNTPQSFFLKKVPVGTQVGLLFCVVLSLLLSKGFVYH